MYTKIKTFQELVSSWRAEVSKWNQSPRLKEPEEEQVDR
jgi:hypothetical protein